MLGVYPRVSKASEDGLRSKKSKNEALELIPCWALRSQECSLEHSVEYSMCVLPSHSNLESPLPNRPNDYVPSRRNVLAAVTTNLGSLSALHGALRINPLC